MADREMPQRGSLAERLEYLFRTIRESGSREYSNEDVAEAITRDQGVTISASYLWYLRTGQRDNPTFKHLNALATFFGVPPAYFFDDAVRDQVEGEVALVTALKNNGVREIAMRASGLSDKSLDSINEIITRVRELEGLPGEES